MTLAYKLGNSIQNCVPLQLQRSFGLLYMIDENLQPLI